MKIDHFDTGRLKVVSNISRVHCTMHVHWQTCKQGIHMCICLPICMHKIHVCDEHGSVWAFNLLRGNHTSIYRWPLDHCGVSRHGRPRKSAKIIKFKNGNQWLRNFAIEHLDIELRYGYMLHIPCSLVHHDQPPTDSHSTVEPQDALVEDAGGSPSAAWRWADDRLMVDSFSIRFRHLILYIYEYLFICLFLFFISILLNLTFRLECCNVPLRKVSSIPALTTDDESVPWTIGIQNVPYLWW